MMIKIYRNYDGTYSATFQRSANGALSTVADNAKTEEDCLKSALSNVACMSDFDGVEVYRVLTFDNYEDELELITRSEKQ